MGVATEPCVTGPDHARTGALRVIAWDVRDAAAGTGGNDIVAVVRRQRLLGRGQSKEEDWDREKLHCEGVSGYRWWLVIAL